jgi:hypothetical protein
VLLLVPWQLNDLSGCRLMQEILNLGHVPLFGMIALAWLGFSLGAFKDRLARARHLYLALACTVLVAGASEVLQVYTGRDVSAQDYLRNLAGGCGALAIWSGLDQRLSTRTPWVWPAFRRSVVALGIGTLLLTLFPLLEQVEAHRRIRDRLPVLFHFDSRWELPFIVPRYTIYDLVPAPSGWPGFSQRLVARVIFRTRRYPGVTLLDFHGDWSGYDALELDLYLEDEQDVELALRIDDAQHDQRYRDRFNRRIPLRPGPNHVRIPVAEIRSAPEGREMDLGAIESVTLFAGRPERRITVYMADLRLVSDRSGGGAILLPGDASSLAGHIRPGRVKR